MNHFFLKKETNKLVIIIEITKSLEDIFPNLSIIRGRELFEGFALLVFSNPHLEEIGLTKLTSISRGGVHIQKISDCAMLILLIGLKLHLILPKWCQ